MKFLFVLVLCVFLVVQTFAQSLSSHYVKMPDGVHLAVDVYLPENVDGKPVPTLIQFERYWRGAVTRKKPEPSLGGRAEYFSRHGYAIVVVDTRGTGASFGTRLSEYSPQEVMDAYDVLEWLVNQSWSNGKVGSYGTSYTGTTAELLCATNHPSVKAVIPGWSDFDVYRSPVRPYGMLASSFIRKWGLYVRLLDRNRGMFLGGHVHPVSKDSMKAVRKDHKDNLQVYRSTKNAEYRQSDMGAFNYEECSVVHWEEEIEKSQVPMLVLTSWMDAGTAEGTIQRLEHFSNPQHVVLMSTTHGGYSNASPFSIDSTAVPKPTPVQQVNMQLDFFDYHLKGMPNGVDAWPKLMYYNMGEEKLLTADSWPIPGTTIKPFFLHVDQMISENAPEVESGENAYKVDFGVETSKKNRWTTQMGGPVKDLNDRGAMDQRMLVYTSEPLVEDLQITGTPELTLHLSSTHRDGAVLVYLEDVDENGVSRYITEGGLRLIHRKEIEDSTNYNLHSFNEEDAQEMIPGQIETIRLKMWPTSVKIKKGHSIRIAIAGADKSTFDRLPRRGKPTITVYSNQKQSSFLILPVVEQ